MADAAKQEKDPESQAREVRMAAVVQAWEFAESNEQAVDALLDMMRKDSMLYAAVMTPHERPAAVELIGVGRRRDRKKTWQKTAVVMANGAPVEKPASGTKKDWVRPSAPDSRVMSLVRATEDLLMDMRLSNGKKLGAANHDEVLKEALAYSESARELGIKARFYSAVAERVPEGKVVSDVLSEEKLREIRNA